MQSTYPVYVTGRRVRKVAREGFQSCQNSSAFVLLAVLQGTPSRDHVLGSRATPKAA